MPARDTYHDAVRKALIRDGWTITHDPFTISFGNTDVYADLGAERSIAAERGEERIAVEIKSFLGASGLRDFQLSLGQFLFYRSLLERVEPDRKLFLAVPAEAFETLFQRPIVGPPIEDFRLAYLVFDPGREEILRWNP
jgi:hypothetical protein